MKEQYIHGFTKSEMQRLTAMQRILNDVQLKTMRFEGVASVLDVGSGLGQLTRAFARRLREAGCESPRVVGIERSEQQINEARRQAEEAGELDLAQFRLGNATDLPLSTQEVGTFDLVHARFLLEHACDPLQIVCQMRRAARPGGTLVLVDDDHELLRVHPECPELDELWRTYWQSYHRHGHDPLIGRKLPSLLQEANVVPTRIDSLFYGAVAGSSLFDPVVDNVIEVFRGAQALLDAQGVLSPGQLDRTLAAIERWRAQAAACLWYGLPYVEGTRPNSDAPAN